MSILGRIAMLLVRAAPARIAPPAATTPLEAVAARSRRVAFLLAAFGGFAAAPAALAAPGDVDPSFGGGGLSYAGFPTRFERVNDIAVQPDGKIVVAGSVTFGTGAARRTRFALARLNPDGTADRSFSVDGVAIAGFPRMGAGRWAGARAVAIQRDGKIVVAGAARNSFALLRYKPNGTLDPSFGGDGKVRTEFTRWDDDARDLVIQDDGRIVVGGRAGNGGGRFALARYRPSGWLDRTFSGDGKLVTNLSPDADAANALALQEDGKIVAVGYAHGAPSSGKSALARYNPDGTLDASFGGGGKVLTDFSPWGEAAYGVALQSDGKIVVAASSLVARYETDGTLDATFGDGGSVEVAFVDTAVPVDVAIQDDGRIVASGDWFVTLARLTTDGMLDTTFGDDGTVFTDFLPDDPWGNSASAMAIQPNGRVVVAGTHYRPVNDHTLGSVGVIARYLAE